MDEQSTHQAQPEPQVDSSDTKGSGLGVWFFWLFVAFVFYILSVGPVLKILRSHYGYLTPAEGIYAPINELCYNCPPALECYFWYLHLWRVPTAIY